MTSLIQWDHLPSETDASVNHILPHSDGGMWETRWVQRTSEYGIVYLSSHTGCAFSCRFCHLTATKQTMMTPASAQDYVNQLEQSLDTYVQRRLQGLAKAQRLHINFMARGEPLNNPTLLNSPMDVFTGLEQHVKRIQPDLDVHYLISSILPNTLDQPLEEVLVHPQSYLYYSLYSMGDKFRKRWLPKALPAEHGLDLCAQYQKATGQRVTLHWAIIEGENDSDADIDQVLEAVSQRGLRAKFNLVRYNPHDLRHGRETSEERLQAIFARIQRALGDPESRIVPRVGFDVKASCGMFVKSQD